MTLLHVNWEEYICTSDPPLPYDVTFRVFSHQEESQGEHISAHKLLLASVSKVFHTQFFGALANDQTVIDIKETTFYAFKFFLQYIYLGIDVKINSEESDLDEVLEILNLAEKYGMVQLAAEISDVITEDLVITEENVMEVSETARMYSCFENVSLLLFNKCSNYYRNIKYKLSSQVQHNSLDQSISESDRSQDVFHLKGGSSQLSEEVRQENNSFDETKRVKLSLRNVSWVRFLNNDTDLPRDITFKFYEKIKTTVEDSVENEVTKYVGEIKAHKFLLASCSEVFKESFFTTSNLLNELIIENSSLSAFKIMIDFIYGRFPKLRGREDICEIFEIENLADQYRIAGLKDEYRASMLLYLRYR